MNTAVEYNTNPMAITQQSSELGSRQSNWRFELYIQWYSWFECLVVSAIEGDSGGWGASDTQSLLPGICLLFRLVVFVVFQKQGSFYTKTTR
jgi:hypothetical protein